MNAKRQTTAQATRETRTALRGALAISLGLTLAACGGQDARPSPLQNQRNASIVGATGTTFNLTARVGYISTPDGASIPSWGYALDDALMQYPGPTLIVEQGAQITVNLSNELPHAMPVSIVFPGQQVAAQGGSEGALTREAAPGETVSYSFTATSPGTYLYQSGTRPELQIEMGLVGALIVRPAMGAHHAYNHAGSAFDQEYLFLLTEMDPKIHQLADAGNFDAIDFSARWPVFWFINGRCSPDTMLHNGVPWLPHQPYNAMPRMHPGDRLLARMVNGGSDLHPFHHHGNHSRIIAVDGRMLESAPGAGPDLSHEVFTLQTVPGETMDAIFEWTGEGLGWDIYGDASTHQCNDGDADKFDDLTREYCPDHGKPFPVTLPPQLSLTFGGHYSGSPFLGLSTALPPGEGGLNPNGGYPFMWHSHTEKEMTNDDIFPGGMMTMLFIEPPGVMIH